MTHCWKLMDWILGLNLDVSLPCRTCARRHFNMDNIKAWFFHVSQFLSWQWWIRMCFVSVSDRSNQSDSKLRSELYVTSHITRLLRVFISFLFCFFPSFRPFHVEPTNIVSVNDDMQRVTDEASAMNKRIHYYSRLTSPTDRALVRQTQGHINRVVSSMLVLPQPRCIKEAQINVEGESRCSLLWSKYLVAECLNKVLCYHKSWSTCCAMSLPSKKRYKQYEFWERSRLPRHVLVYEGI